MDTFTPGFNLNKWSPDKSDLTRWYYELAKYLEANPIPGDDTISRLISDYLKNNPIEGNFYGPENPPPYPVTSVNGKTGAVTIAEGTPGDAYNPDNPPPYPVKSVNGQTGAVSLKTVDVVSLDNPDPYAKIWVDESEEMEDEYNMFTSITNYTYQGVDLTQVHATEIAAYASAWEWFNDRVKNGNFTKIHIGDYIPFTTTNNLTFHAQIAGINTYKGYGDVEIGNVADFISKELWPVTFEMNMVNTNNGVNEEKKVPWLASNGYLFVNSLAGQVPNGTTKPLEMADVDYTAGGMYFYLPNTLKAVIVEKRVYAPTRYSESGVLNNDNSGEWVNMGKLWLPDEYEVTGARLMTTMGWFSGGFVQYPIFAHNMNRLKRIQGGNSRYYWWLSSALSGNSTGFVLVNHNGLVSNSNASYSLRAPFCFRLGGK